MIGPRSRGFIVHSFRHRNLRQCALWLAIAAVLLRAMLPDGFMLQGRHGGGLELAICYASPLAKLRADQGQTDLFHLHGDCAFAACAVPALPSAAAVADFGPAAAAPALAFNAFGFVSASDRRLPPARAPPLVS
jgi:hypothetical protein